MDKIPFAELALGAARKQAFAEGLAAGASAGRLFARQQDDKRDAQQRRLGAAHQLATARQPGFQLWQENASSPVVNTNAAGAYSRLVAFTGDEAGTAQILGINLTSERARDVSLSNAARAPTRWFDNAVGRSAAAGRPAEPFEQKLDAGGRTTSVQGRALVFTNSAGERLFFSRGAVATPAIAEVSPLQGRLRPNPRSPYAEERATVYELAGTIPRSAGPERLAAIDGLYRLFPDDAPGVKHSIRDPDSPATQQRKLDELFVADVDRNLDELTLEPTQAVAATVRQTRSRHSVA